MFWMQENWSLPKYVFQGNQNFNSLERDDSSSNEPDID
jgi:hypothetical protein